MYRQRRTTGRVAERPDRRLSALLSQATAGNLAAAMAPAHRGRKANAFIMQFEDCRP